MSYYLSHSQIADWFTCRFKHSLRYKHRIKPREKPESMELGILVHEGISAGIRGHVPFHADGPRIATERINEIVAEKRANTSPDDEFGMAMLENLEDMAEKAIQITHRVLRDLDLDQWETIQIPMKTVEIQNGEKITFHEPLIEKSLVTSIEGWDGYIGIFDWVAKDLRDGTVWLVDFKVRGSLQADETEESNLQAMSYLKILADHGIHVDGVLIYQVLSKVPAEPKINKDGSVARSKIATTWAVYQQTVLRQGLNPDDYMDMKAKLDTEFFRETRILMTPEQVERAWYHIIVPAASDIGKGVAYRSLSNWTCKGCVYREPCLAQLQGYDVSSILEEKFTRG